MKFSVKPEKIWKDHKFMEVKEHPNKNEWVNQEIKEKIKKYKEANENENT